MPSIVYLPGTATVSSVAVSVPSILSVSGSPITTSGTIAISLSTQIQKTFFAGPTSGANAVPTFRVVALADLPSGIVLTTGSQTITGSLTLTHTATAGGDAPIIFGVVGAAHTNITASTEDIDIYFSLSRTVQFATGALTTQRAILITPPTYAFVGSSTITTAVTAEITGAPVAGTNATITNKISLRVLAGIATGIPLVLKGAGSQTANLFKIVNSSDTELFGIGATGQIRTGQATGFLAAEMINSFPIYDVSGTLLGYVPIYNLSGGQ